MSSLPNTSTALVAPSPDSPLELQTLPLPPVIPSGSALVRILATTIRPHNRTGFAGKSFLPFPFPYIPGWSAIARILSVGPDALALQPGQLVFVNGFMAARDDPLQTQVLLGLTASGEREKKLFDFWGGCWRDVAMMPLESCIPLNEDVLVRKLGYAFAELEYIERLAVANGGVRAASLKVGETVIV